MFFKSLISLVLLAGSISFSAHSSAEACKTDVRSLENLDFRVRFTSGTGEEKWVNILKKDLDVFRDRDEPYFTAGVDFATSMQRVRSRGSFKKSGIAKVFIISKRNLDRSVATLAQLSTKNDPFAKIEDNATAKGKRLKLNINVPRAKRKSLTRLLVTTQHTCSRNKAGKLVVDK